MTNIQRMKSDIATADRREMEDTIVKENRIKNDELTNDRRYKVDKGRIASNELIDSREKNDELTMEKRSRTDREIEVSRLRNDEMTANRRETIDQPVFTNLAVFLLTVVVLEIGILISFI